MPYSAMTNKCWKIQDRSVLFCLVEFKEGLNIRCTAGQDGYVLTQVQRYDLDVDLSAAYSSDKAHP
jgi:hypothetical protein